MQKNVTQLYEITPEQLKSEIVYEIKQYLDEKFADNENKDELLTRKQVSKLIGVSLPTLRSYVKRGLIIEKRVGARVLYSKKELLASLL